MAGTTEYFHRLLRRFSFSDVVLQDKGSPTIRAYDNQHDIFQTRLS